MATSIEELFSSMTVDPGSVGLVWLGQAGYLLKSPGGVSVMVDPYLSDYAEQQWGLPRAIPPAIDHRRVDPTLFLSSHWHEDHLDQPIVRYYASRPEVIFAGPLSCIVRAIGWGWPEERVRLLSPGESTTVGDVTVTATFARHETPTAPAPDAIGFLLDMAGYRVWDVADTEYDARLRAMADEAIDLAIIPVNGVGGNLTDREAALLLSYVQPKVAVPMHYNMWAPEGFGPGATLDPTTFVSSYQQFGGGATRILDVSQLEIFSR